MGRLGRGILDGPRKRLPAAIDTRWTIRLLSASIAIAVWLSVAVAAICVRNLSRADRLPDVMASRCQSQSGTSPHEP